MSFVVLPGNEYILAVLTSLTTPNPAFLPTAPVAIKSCSEFCLQIRSLDPGIFPIQSKTSVVREPEARLPVLCLQKENKITKNEMSKSNMELYKVIVYLYVKTNENTYLNSRADQ